MEETKKSVFYTEDSEHIYSYFKFCLKREGYEVLHTDNFEDAEKIISEKKFDVYLLDGTILAKKGGSTSPMNGLKLYKKITEKYGKDQKVVFISGDEKLKKICDEIKIPFLRKPVEWEQLKEYL